jgi:hypothetical protein
MSSEHKNNSYHVLQTILPKMHIASSDVKLRRIFLIRQNYARTRQVRSPSHFFDVCVQISKPEPTGSSSLNLFVTKHR